ncbi:hypothetical protein [Rhizobium sp. NZLR8]|uniref:hypothetical protein n=1 Tax=Rhizobium sp. NZLR8 TaxID=2731104 RepID=UPI001C831A1B|nr:hypothetical protein [Rhizobium sp. NZLR8]
MSAICQMLASEPEEEILPVRAIGALSALVAARFEGGEGLELAVDTALLKALPADVQTKCEAAANEAEAIGAHDAKILCFRPSCIAKDAERPALCKPFVGLSQDTVSKVRKIFSRDVTCGAGTDCVSVAPEALEAILAVDMLRDFQAAVMAGTEGGVCKGFKEDACVQILWNLVNITIKAYQDGARLHYIAQSIGNSQLANAPGLRSAINSFETLWSTVEKRAADQKTKENVTLFVLAPGVREALSKADSAAVNLRAQLTKIVEDRRLVAAKKILEAGSALYTQASSEPILAIFKDDWKARGFVDIGSDLTPRQAAELIRDFGTTVDKVAWILRATPGLPADPSTGVEAMACTDGKTSFDLQKGQFDMCYQKVDANLPPGRLVGLRYSFVPCAPNSDQDDCQYIGSLSLLVSVPTPDAQKSAVAALGLGANKIRARLDAGQVLRISSLVPKVSYDQASADLQALVDRLLPSPLAAQVSEIRLDDGPTISFRLAAGTALAEKTVFKITVTPKGILLDDKALKDELVKVVADRVGASLKGKTLRYGDDLTLSVDDATVVTSDPACLQRNTPELSILVRADTKIAGAPVFGQLYSCGTDFRLKLNLKQDLLLTALVRKFDVAPGNVKIYFVGDRPHALITLEKTGCTHEVDVDILASSSQNINDLVKKFAAEEVKCHAGDFASQADSLLKQLGFYQTKDSGVYCTASIAEIGSICVRDVTNPSQDMFTVVEDENLKNRLSAKLQSVFGAKSQVSALSVTKSGIGITANIDVPMLGLVKDVSAKVNATGGSVGVDLNIYPALRAAINDKAAVYLQGVTLKAAGVEVSNLALAGEDASRLAVTGKISYGGIPADIEIQLMPNLKFKPSVPNVGLEILKQLLGPIGKPGTFDVAIGPDGIPILTGKVEVSLPIEGVPLTASTTITARAGGPLRFNGPVSFVLPGWYTVSYVDIGRIRASLDLNKPLENITVGASIALPTGEATYDIAAVDADLTIGSEELTLKGTLSLLKMPLGQTVGIWKFKQGILDIDVSGGAASDILPLPSGHLTVDGPACAVVGTASAKVLGTKLVNVDAGVFLGKPCNASAAKTALVTSLIEKCGGRGPAGEVCLGGKASFGDILNAEGLLVARLDQLIPRITGKIDLRNVANFDVSVNAAQAAFRTKVLGFRVSLILPSVDGLNEDFLRRLIENLLKPSIDLSALAKGNITIAPASKAGSGDDSTTSSGQSSGEENGQDGKTTPSANKGTTPTSSTPQQQGGNYKWQPGKALPSIKEIPGTGLFRVMVTIGGSTFPEYRYAFQQKDAEDLVSGSIGLPSVPTVFKDDKAYVVACTSWPCRLDALQAVRAYDTSAKADAPPAERIDLKLIDAEKPLLVDGTGVLAAAGQSYFNLPSLVSFLADRQLNERPAVAKIYCVRREAACKLALIQDQDRYFLSDTSPWEITELEKGSIAQKVYAKACPSAPCSIQPLIDNLDALMSRSHLIVQGSSPDDGLPTAVVMSSWKDGKDSRTIMKLGPNLEVLGTAPFNLSPSSWEAAEKAPAIHPALSAVVDAAAADIQQSSDFQAETNLPTYAALLDTGAGTIWSSLQMGDKACIRKSKTSDMAAKIAEWKDNDFINAQHADVLTAATGMRTLVSDFVHPFRSVAAFRTNPLLLQGDPTKDCPK